MPGTDGVNARAQLAVAVAKAVALLGLTAGVSVLAAWLFDIRWLRQPIPTAASMKPNTAVGIAGAGLALWLLAQSRHPRLAAGLGAVVALVALVTLSQDVFGWSAGIDELLFADVYPTVTVAPGRMAPMTAFCLALLGLALVSARGQSLRLSQGAALVALGISSVAVFGYLYGVEALYGVGPYTSMAPHTAVLLSLLAIGVLCVSPTVGVIALVVSREVEGVVSRWLLLAGIAIPALLGTLPLAERSDLYQPEFGAAVMVVGTIGLLSFVVLANASVLRRMRSQSDAALRAANETLQLMVARRTDELAHRERELRLIVEEARDAFVAIDAQGRIVEVNQNAEDMFGWPRGKILGRLAADTLIPVRYREAPQQGLHRFVTEGEGGILDRLLQVEALHRDGHEFPVEISMAAVWFEDQWRFNAFIRDVTEAKETQRHLQEALSDKEALLKEVHHRVKNNLQVISSFLRLQAGSLTDPAAIAALRQSEERVMSIALLHENLYRSDNLGRVDFDRYLGALAAELLRAYPTAEGRITLATESDVPALEIENAVPLGLLVNELVTNALKHAFPDGRRGHVSARVSVSADGARGTLTVSDDGVGFQAAAAAGGTSTGLAIVDALSRQLGGRARFTHDGGTNFTLEFPLRGVGVDG
jgi:PAS domain S-box-containing protein